MTFIEMLENRQLFAADMLDASFGQDGIVVVGGESIDSPALLGVQGDIYVEKRIDGNPFISRLNQDGLVELAWGTDGNTSVSFDPERFLWDKWHQKLYAIGMTHFGPIGNLGNNVLHIARYTSTGFLDAGFGDSGEITYTIGTEQTDLKHFELKVECALVTRKGGIVVSGIRTMVVNESTQTQDPETSVSSYSYQDEVAVIKFQPDGRRDRTFGHRGASVIARTFSTIISSYYATENHQHSLKVYNLIPKNEGGYRIVWGDDFSYQYNNFEGDPSKENHLDLNDSVILADGINPVNRSYRVLSTRLSDESVLHETFFSVIDVVIRNNIPVVLASIDFSKGRMIELSSNHPAVVKSFVGSFYPGAKLLSDRRGGYFNMIESLAQLSIQRLRANTVINKRWADKGTYNLIVDTDSLSNRSYSVDENGKLLISQNGNLYRVRG